MPHEKKMLLLGIVIVVSAIASGWFAVAVALWIVGGVVRFFS